MEPLKDNLSVCSNQITSTLETTTSLESRLVSYQSISFQDDPVELLGILYKYLPLQGQSNLADDIHSCRDDKELHRLAERLDMEFLRPSLFQERKNTIAARYRDEDDTESLDNDTKSLLENCMRRDGRKCVVTKIRA